MDKEIYRGQYPPKNTNLMWVKGKQIYLFDGTTGTWVEVNESTQVDQTFDPTSERAVSAPAILNAAEENLSETSENLIKNKAVYNQYVDDGDVDDLLSILDLEYLKDMPLTFVALENGLFYPMLNQKEDVETINGKPINLQYSFNNGEWVTIDFDNWEGIVVKKGDTISLRGDNTYFCMYDYDMGEYVNALDWNQHDGKCTWRVKGNIVSLLYSDDYKDRKNISSNSFTSLFANYGEEHGDKQKTACIIDAQDLIINAVADAAYSGLFKDNPIKYAPKELKLFALSYNSVYEKMFYGCDELIEAPKFIGEYVGTDSCKLMFYGCSSLEKISDINITEVADYGCAEMFEKCTSLKHASNISIKKVGQLGCSYMFSGCSSLLDAPKLADNVATRCYSGMFEYCTSLTESPKLPVKNILQATSCYERMFYECSNLSKIDCDVSIFVDKSINGRSNYCYDWVHGVAESGIFIKKVNGIFETGDSGIPENWEVQTDTSYLDNINEPLTFTAMTSGTFDVHLYEYVRNLIEGNEIEDPEINLEFKYNDSDWEDWTQNGSSIELSVNVGDTIKLRGDNDKLCVVYGDELYGTLDFNDSTAKFTISGNIKSILKRIDFASLDLQYGRNNNAFWMLFGSDEYQRFSNLKYAGELILPSKSTYGQCGQMFARSGLYVAPYILNKTRILSDECRNMFSQCKDLLSAVSEINVTRIENYGCAGMFSGCTSLEKVPNVNADILDQYCCTHMFSYCTKLEKAPAIPQITGSFCFYYMFAGCQNLKEAPILSATILRDGCYSNMFSGCYSLETAPGLPATEFSGAYCYESMFSACINLINAPELPIETLRLGCYKNMFYGCRSLTKAPILNAKILAKECYYGMFRNCSSLSEIKCLATDISAQDCTKEWTNGVSANGTFIKDREMNNWTSGKAGIPNNWIVQNA